MGHADIKTTMQIYAEVTQQAKADAGVRLSGNLGIAILFYYNSHFTTFTPTMLRVLQELLRVTPND